jgi:hypothetical protein
MCERTPENSEPIVAVGRRRLAILVMITAVSFASVPFCVRAQSLSDRTLDSHRLIIKFKSGSEMLRLARTQISGWDQSESHGTNKVAQLGNLRLRPVKPNATLDPLPGGVERLFVATLDENTDRGRVLTAIKKIHDIEYVEAVNSTDGVVQNFDVTPTIEQIEGSARFPSDQYFSKQWALRNTGDNSGPSFGKPGVDLGMLPAWAITTGSSDVTIAFLPWGIRTDVFDFLGRVSRNGYNFYGDNNDVTDEMGLGTFVVGAAAATGNNSYSIAGVDWRCTILPIRITEPNKIVPTLDRLVRAIVYASDENANVICTPYLNFTEGLALTDALTYALSKGCITVAGYTPGWGLSPPRDRNVYPGVIFIGSVDSRGARYSSMYGDVDFMAPGKDICGTEMLFPYHYRVVSGPYPACALAAGVISLMLSLNKTLTFQEIYDILKESAVDQEGPAYEDTPGWDQYHGWGRINAYRALRLVQERMKALPEAFGTSTNYPNPFNSHTIIQYDLKYPMHVSITIYNLLGQPVVTLLDEDKEAGYHHARWDAKVASGVYIYRLQARPLSGSGIGERVIVNKMILTK